MGENENQQLMMDGKKKIVVEILLNTSPELLYSRLSTYTGLAEWFADNVSNDGNIFTFTWKNTSQEAEVLLKKEPKLIRYKWLDDDCEECYFEFEIDVDDLTKATALTITDFVDEGDEESSIKLWHTQLDKLKHVLGAS